MIFEIKSSYKSSHFGSNVEQWGDTQYKINRPEYDNDLETIKKHCYEQFGYNLDNAKLTKLIGNIFEGIKCYTFGKNMIDFSYLCTMKKTGTNITFMDKTQMDFSYPRNIYFTVFEHIITPANSEMKFTGKYKGDAIGTSNMLNRRHDTIIYTIMKNNEITIKFYPEKPIRFTYENSIQKGSTFGKCIIETKKNGDFTYNFTLNIENEYGIINRQSNYKYIISKID